MENDIKIRVNDVYVRFNMASERVDNIKEYVIKVLKRQLLFQEFIALKGISFDVRAGESWGFIGSNGSGKSTLLKTISGILKPYKGSVTVNGSISPLIELGAGFDGNMTARENVFLNGCVLGYSESFIREKFDEIIDFAEVRDFLDVPLKNFSSGMAARLGFSIATTVKPDILICDEVLAVGDFKFQEKCEKRMNELLSGGTTLLFVSHSAEQVKRMCKKAIWIDHGEMRMIGDASEVCEAYKNS
ncbi:ABC transporter ATP-binding protein [Treponema saccharophilum]|uniref:ABC transporter related protein n=1 Tax=Treponema saccharophilum DSM 2985 TaxID=907348 RepID=H7EPH9_9SPIR|nr:ABC transporter ATP-binding protein [Treponema saccharophilum]EIC00380.1 ABC transporter related protein [Treponema saccharophilum DSM 2985]BDC94916.1 teichoic acid ABC transporter ATP-binding protein [Treponema saccharophilum]